MEDWIQEYSEWYAVPHDNWIESMKHLESVTKACVSKHISSDQNILIHRKSEKITLSDLERCLAGVNRMYELT